MQFTYCEAIKHIWGHKIPPISCQFSPKLPSTRLLFCLSHFTSLSFLFVTETDYRATSAIVAIMPIWRTYTTSFPPKTVRFLSNPPTSFNSQIKFQNLTNWIFWINLARSWLWPPAPAASNEPLNVSAATLKSSSLLWTASTTCSNTRRRSSMKARPLSAPATEIISDLTSPRNGQPSPTCSSEVSKPSRGFSTTPASRSKSHKVNTTLGLSVLRFSSMKMLLKRRFWTIQLNCKWELRRFVKRFRGILSSIGNLTWCNLGRDLCGFLVEYLGFVGTQWLRILSSTDREVSLWVLVKSLRERIHPSC